MPILQGLSNIVWDLYFSFVLRIILQDPSLKRPSAAARRIRKASRTSTDSSGSQRKASTVVSQETPKTPACIVCGKPSRNNSIYCSDTCILKHAQGVEKVTYNLLYIIFDKFLYI